jgi:hypothetical protein
MGRDAQKELHAKDRARASPVPRRDGSTTQDGSEWRFAVASELGIFEVKPNEQTVWMKMKIYRISFAFRGREYSDKRRC